MHLAFQHGYEEVKWAIEYIQNEQFADLRPSMSDTEVYNYVTADFWENTGFYYYNLEEYPQGGSKEYNPMKQLYLTYYPWFN